ncbi:ABC transporter substrate-binding protein [Enemella evansiae]|nr:sugar ABC transporter substrate-binding protein [Enemella evansiae]
MAIGVGHRDRHVRGRRHRPTPPVRGPPQALVTEGADAMEQIAMKRRTFVTGALGLAAAIGLSGCTGAAGGPSSNTQNGKKTLTVAVWSYATTPEFKALFDAFQVANPDIAIQPVDILAADYQAKITTMLAGGDTTDLIAVKNVTDYSQYTSRGQLADLTDVVKKQLPGNELANLDAYELNGKYFAAPYRSDFWVLFYNKTLFDKAGVPSPGNITWDQYADLAKKLTTGTTSSGQKVYGAYQHTWRSVVQAISAAQTGGNLIGGDYAFFTPRYQMTLDLQKAGSIMDYATAKNNKTSYNSVFQAGQVAMMPMGSWQIAPLLADKAAGKTNVEWAIAPMPQPQSGGQITTFGSPTAFAVNKKSENAEAAQRFIAFAAGDQGARAISAVGIVPALQNAAVTDGYFANKGMPNDGLSKTAFQPGSVGLEMPVNPISSKVDTILTEQHDLIMTGQKSIADGIAEMNSRVKPVIASQ